MQGLSQGPGVTEKDGLEMWRYPVPCIACVDAIADAYFLAAMVHLALEQVE